MRVLCLVALVVLVAFQCTYWFGPSGYFATRQLDAELKHQREFNLEVMQRNQELREEIRRGFAQVLTAMNGHTHDSDTGAATFREMPAADDD